MPEQLRQGPTTFALDGDGPVGASDVPQLGVPNANPGALAPGLQTQAPGVNDVDSKTFRAITDLASGVLAPKIKEAAQDQFLRGVQRAMTGESLGEIVRDQPWYTDIFAPSSALAGARTYTAQRSVAEWGAKMQEQMPALAKQGPEELQKAATGALQGFMTGDAAADGMITSAVVEQMAPLFKQHAKEHYIHVQKVASQAQIGAWEGLGKVYQGFAAAEASGKGTVSPEDKEAAKSRLLGAIAPFADQSDEAFERNIAAFLEGSASAGNFQVVKLFKEAGLYDQIAPDKRAALDRSIRVFARDTLNKATPAFAMDIATLVNDMTQDPRSIPDKVSALNAKAAALTGVTETDLIPPTAIDNIMGGIMRAQSAEAAARAKVAQTAAEKDAEKVGEVALAASQIQNGPGYVDACTAMGVCKEQAVEKAGALAYAAAKTPQDRAKVLNARTLKAFDGIKSAFTATLRSPEYQKGVGDMAQTYEALADNVKPLYFDDHERALMDRFTQLVQSGTPPEGAWVAVNVAPMLSANGIPEGSKNVLAKAIREEVERQNESWYYVNNVDAASMRMIEAVTMRSAKLDAANNPPDVAAKRGYATARPHVDVQGKHAIFQHQANATPLARIIGEGVKQTAESFEELMAEKAKSLGVALDNYEIIRVPDRGGQAYFQVLATDDSGKTVPWSITSQEVKARAEAAVRKSMERPAPVPPTPPVTGPGGAAFGLFPRP